MHQCWGALRQACRLPLWMAAARATTLRAALAAATPLQDHTNNSATRGYFMDGGAIIAGYNGKILAGPVYSNNQASIDNAKAGCPSDPAYVGLYGDHEPCKFVEVPGYDSNEEFILAAPVSRGEILAAKTYQVGTAPCTRKSRTGWGR